MRQIELTGKYAVGEHRYALVDDEDFAYLSQWRWKAKPNGGRNNIYAVRNTSQAGRQLTIRMHREIAGLALDDPREPDHKDHNGLNNVRANLLVTNRAGNLANGRRNMAARECQQCGCAFTPLRSIVGRMPSYCSTACERLHSPQPRHSCVTFKQCVWCERSFVARLSTRLYCSRSCECKAKYRRRVERGDESGAHAPA